MLNKIQRWKSYNVANMVFIIILVIYSYFIFNSSYIGLGVELKGDSWVINRADSFGAGYQSGVREGNIIVKIDNIDTGHYPTVKKWHEIEGASSITVKTTEKGVNIKKIPKAPFLSNLSSEFAIFILGIFTWLVGHITIIKRPFLLQARALFWLTYFVGLALILSPASGRIIFGSRELERICISLISPLLINFVMQFPVERNKKVKFRFVVITTLITIVTTALVAFKWLGIITSISLIKNIILLQVLSGSFITLWNLFSSIRLPVNRPEKNQAFFALLGMALGLLPFVLLSAFPLLLYGRPILNPKISVLFISAIPFSLSYIIVNKYLPDGQKLFTMIMAYLIPAIFTAIILPLLFLFTGVYRSINFEKYSILSTEISLALVSFVLFNFIFKILFINHKFNNQEFSNKINELNISVAYLNEKSLAEELIRELELEGAMIISEDLLDDSYYLNAEGIFKQNSDIQQTLKTFYLDAKGQQLPATLLPSDIPAEVFLPFFTEDFSCGIFLGHRCSQVRFEYKDLSRLILLSYQLGQRLEALNLVKRLNHEINKMAKKIIKSQEGSLGLRSLNSSLFRNIEGERKAVAREIHDGPLQLGLEVNRRLKNLLEEYADENKLSNNFSTLQEIVEDLNYELRSVCSNLRPPSLTDLGLIPAVESMCKQIMKNEFLVITLKVENVTRNQRFEEDVELGAFRFLQEGLSNVVKHSKAHQAEVQISIKKNKLLLIVQDSGRGFNTSQIKDWSLTGKHFGIIGMRERVKGLDGDFIIKTQPGRGVKLMANIPI